MTAVRCVLAPVSVGISLFATVFVITILFFTLPTAAQNTAVLELAPDFSPFYPIKQYDGLLSRGAVQIPSLSNMLTYVASIGADSSLPDDFLIIRPNAAGVDERNNVYVIEGGKIKIFNELGKPAGIISGPYEIPKLTGSNELEPFTISPTGFIELSYRLNIRGTLNELIEYYVYDKIFQYIAKVHENKYHTIIGYAGFTPKLYVLSPKEYIGITSELRIENGTRILTERIIHYKNGNETVIATIERFAGIVPDIGERYTSASLSYPSIASGKYFWDVTSDLNVVYLNTLEDRVYSEKEGFYTIHFYNLKTGKRNELKQLFKPEKIVSRPSSLTTIPIQSLTGVRAPVRSVVDTTTSFKYLESLRSIIIDGLTLFVILNERNNNREYKTDIFDVSGKKYLKAIYFPSDYTSCRIKNGFFYKTGYDEKARLDVIIKYIIDPDVYKR